MDSLVRQIENNPTSSGDSPVLPVVIENCGVLSPDDPSLNEDLTAVLGDPYEEYPADDPRDTDKPEVSLEIATDIRGIANKLFKEGKFEQAFKKYQSTVLVCYYSGCFLSLSFLIPIFIRIRGPSVPR